MGILLCDRVMNRDDNVDIAGLVKRSARATALITIFVTASHPTLRVHGGAEANNMNHDDPFAPNDPDHDLFAQSHARTNADSQHEPASKKKTIRMTTPKRQEQMQNTDSKT